MRAITEIETRVNSLLSEVVLMDNLRDIFVKKTLSIKSAIKQMDVTSKKILVVVDDNDLLLGVITDGDIRRWILSSGDLELDVSHIMNTSPSFVFRENIEDAFEIMKEKFFDAIPIVNNEMKVIDIAIWNQKINGKLRSYSSLTIPVVIMAGGKGTRLYPYTKILPKPLVPIGDTPIVERIIERFTEYGVKTFYMTVNYRKNMIKSYFEEVEKGYSLHFIEESKPLGTGGSLYLLKDELSQTPFIVSNCDILVDADYTDLYHYHQKNKHHITMVTSLKNFQIPYGVVELDDHGLVKKTVEKPEHTHLINTGMYVIEPEVLNLVPTDSFFHITELIELAMFNGMKVGAYPVSEDAWLDMGQFKEMENMKRKLGVKD